LLYLIGVPVSNEGRLEVSTVNIANINSPSITFLGNQTSSYYWSSAGQKTCLPYSGNADTNSPLLIVQFGVKTYFTNLYPNRTIDFPANFQGVGFSSNRLFSLTGAVGPLDWFTAVANVSSADTNSRWTGLRFNATAVVQSSRE
jgi:hypothetical protein